MSTHPFLSIHFIILCRSCVLVDEEGEEISPRIESSKLFWEFASNYSPAAKHSFLLYVNKGKSSILETARRGKLRKEEIYKPNYDDSTDVSTSQMSSSSNIVQSNHDSDDSGSDEYDMRINHEHLRLIAEKTTPNKQNEESKFSPASEDDLILNLPEVEPPVRPRSLTDLQRPSLADKHRQEVEKILAETTNTQNSTHLSTNRRSSLVDQKRYFVSFQSSGTISTSQYKKQNRRASTGMDRKDKLNSISKEDAALLALAKKSLRRQITDDDINLLKVALPQEHLAKIHEWSVAAETTIPEENEESIEDPQEKIEEISPTCDQPSLLSSGDGELRETQDRVIVENEGIEPIEFTSHIVNPQNPQDEMPIDNSALSGPSRRKSNKFSLSKEDEELLQLARSSFQTNNPLTDPTDYSQLNVTDGEALRLLMTIESSRSASLNHSITPSKQAVAEKIRKLSPADEALLMLARHSIHPVASDSDILSEYLSKTSELFSIDESKRENEIVDEEDDVDFPRADRGSMISLKEIHRKALLEAFQTICEYPNQLTDPSTDGYLTYEKFLEWEQIQNVLAEKVLNEELVHEEFQKLATSGNITNHIIRFVEFCDLMERLEILAEQLSAPADPGTIDRIESSEENIGIPTDIRRAFNDLLASQTDQQLTGVTLESILSWNQLQNAIHEKLLSREDVEQSFGSVAISHELAASNCLDLQQFYQVSLELQRKIDISIGDLNALDKLAVPVMDEQMRLEASETFSQHPSRGHRRGSYRETLGDSSELYQNSSRQSKQRNMSIYSAESFESSVQDTFEQPNFTEIESELSKILITGHLFKQGGKVKSWKKRKFILKGCRLSYYDTKKLKGEFNTRDCEVTMLPPSECNGSQYGFLINGPGRKLLLYANSDDDRTMWMNALRERIEEQERISQWEEQVNQMNKYQEEYNRTHSAENCDDTPLSEGSDDEDESGLWKSKHSINSLRINPEEENGKQVHSTISNGGSIWQQFLDSGEILLCTGEIIKRNKYGMSQKRQLLLAKQLSGNSPPRLFYVDPSTMKVKGEMEWDNQKAPQAEFVSVFFHIYFHFSILRLMLPHLK